MASEFEDLQRIFFLECEEFVGSAEQSVESIRDGDGGTNAINALFRAVHSIKGGAGAFGLGRLQVFAHAFESYMELMREDRATPDPGAVELLFDGVDVLRMLVDEAQNAIPAAPERHDAALAALRAAAGLADDPAVPGQGGMKSILGTADPLPAAGSDPAAARSYRIRFAPGTSMLVAGVDPLLILRALKSLGAATVEIDPPVLPALTELDPAVCAFAWT